MISMPNANQPEGAPDITVALPNYNGAELLRNNIPILFRALKKAELSAEVLVIDDASADDSSAVVASLTAEYPQLRFLAQPVNKGFAETCNKGIEAARAPLLCLVNTDVQFDEAYFVYAVQPILAGEADVTKGVIHNYSTDPAQPHYIDTQTRVSLRRGMARAEPQEKKHRGASVLIAKLGCCFVARTDVLRQIGGFDARYSPYYWEDVELGWQVLKRGFRLVYVEQAKIFHQENSTIGKLSPERKKQVSRVRARNRLLFTWTLLRDGGLGRWLVYGLWEVWRLVSRGLRGDFVYHLAFADAVKRRRLSREAS